MRLNPRISVCLSAISLSCVGLLFVYCNVVQSEESKKANPRIKELQQKRLAVLEKVHEAAKHSFANARTSFEDVHTANVALLTARLEYADTQKDRIQACDEAVRDATEWQTIVGGMVQSSRATAITAMKAEAYLLETQLAREKAGNE